MTIIAAFVIVSGAAYAQSGLLKGIGDKAKQAAGQQLKKNIGNALGLGGVDNTSSQNNSAANSTYYDSTPSMSYAQDLMEADYPINFAPEGVVKSTYNFKSYKDALKARLDLPKAGSLNSVDDCKAYAAKQADLHQGVVDLCTRFAQKQNDLTNQSLHGPYLSQSGSKGSAYMNVSQEEVFKALQDAGVNPATATEDQVMDAVATYISKKNGVPKDQVLKQMKEGKANEKPKHRINEIQEELSAIYETQLMSGVNATANAINSLSTALLSGKATVDETSLSGALFTLRRKIIASWPKSEACKEVNKLQAQQGSKSIARQNEIIDKWNSKQLDIWVAKISGFVESEGQTARKIAELDAELESMSDTEKKSADWADAKLSVIKLHNAFINYMDIPGMVFDCPLVRHAESL